LGLSFTILFCPLPRTPPSRHTFSPTVVIFSFRLGTSGLSARVTFFRIDNRKLIIYVSPPFPLVGWLPLRSRSHFADFIFGFRIFCRAWTILLVERPSCFSWLIVRHPQKKTQTQPKPKPPPLLSALLGWKCALDSHGFFFSFGTSANSPSIS